MIPFQVDINTSMLLKKKRKKGSQEVSSCWWSLYPDNRSAETNRAALAGDESTTDFVDGKKA